MKKQMKISLVGVIIAWLLLLTLAACNLPGSADGGLLGAAGEERAIPATPFLEGDAVDYGDEVLILREVSAAEGSAIDRIVIWLPPQVGQLALHVNGSPAGTSKIDENTLIELSKPETVVLLEFLDENGAVVKSCQVDFDDILSPQGDCAW